MLKSILSLLLGVTTHAFTLPSSQKSNQDTYTRPVTAYNGVDITCANATYCTFQQELYEATLVDNTTLAPRYIASIAGQNTTQLNLTLTNTVTGITEWNPASSLLLTMNVYQNGILQINIANPEETWSRFRISDYDIGVEWSQL